MSESVTRSPIELFWTAKDNNSNKDNPITCAFETLITILTIDVKRPFFSIGREWTVTLSIMLKFFWGLHSPSVIGIIIYFLGTYYLCSQSHHIYRNSVLRNILLPSFPRYRRTERAVCYIYFVFCLFVCLVLSVFLRILP